MRRLTDELLVAKHPLGCRLLTPARLARGADALATPATAAGSWSSRTGAAEGPAGDLQRRRGPKPS